MASKEVAKQTISLYQKWIHHTSRYCRVGLYRDDMYTEFLPFMAEAVRRLPAKEQDERIWRMSQAIHYDMLKRYLPKEEWITVEEDFEKGRYLEPYIKEIVAETNEAAYWDHWKKTISFKA